MRADEVVPRGFIRSRDHEESFRVPNPRMRLRSTPDSAHRSGACPGVNEYAQSHVVRSDRQSIPEGMHETSCRNTLPCSHSAPPEEDT